MSVSELVAQNLITWDDALNHSLYPKELIRPAGMPAAAMT